MKVCTDACILGAWFAAKVAPYTSILDIGSGTGLLMLMMAQKTNAEIHGIEIDLSSFKQLKENCIRSKWSERLTVYPGDVRSFVFPGRYDFIICNPPFFENDLLSVTEEEQIAKHSILLGFEDLLETMDTNLKPDGAVGILLPYHRWKHFNELAAVKGLHLTEKLFVKQTPRHPYFRAILHYSRSKENFIPEFELIIHEEKGKYTAEFTELMKEFYYKL